MFHHDDNLDQLPLRQLALAVQEVLSQQNIRLAKHSWGDSWHLEAEKVGILYPADRFFPIAAVTGTPNLSLEDTIIMYQLVRLPQANTTHVQTFVEAVFPLFGDVQSKHDHANYFENVLQQLIATNYPLKRQDYVFVADEHFRKVQLPIGTFPQQPISQDEITTLSQALIEAYDDWKRIFA
jgi:hypothetical protein